MSAWSNGELDEETRVKRKAEAAQLREASKPPTPLALVKAVSGEGE